MGFQCWLVVVLVILLLVGLLKLYKAVYLVKYCKSQVCLVGKTVIVTGGNGGIGFETALNLACRGARVILACRSEQRGADAVEKIKKLTRNNNVVLKLLDLASFKSIREFAKDIIENEKKIDILINNAGIMGYGEGLTEDGLQVEWQSNHFGPALLTLLLLDVMKKSAPSRIIIVSSSIAKFYNMSAEDLNVYYSFSKTYANTKIANIFFAQELAKKLNNTDVSVFSLHPGVVATDILPLDFLGKMVKSLLKEIVKFLFYLSPEEGAQTSLYCAVEQGIEELSGSHFDVCQVVGPYKSVQDPALGKQVWDQTLKLIKYEKTE